MPAPLVLLSLPGLRDEDVARMPALNELRDTGSGCRIEHSFPGVTWPSQCNLLTGTLPREHGVVANGFYWRDRNEVEMWTAWNDVIERPQLWDLVKAAWPGMTTAAWFPMLAKGCGADVVCMPAPIHKPDGSEEMWCHTRPQEFYGELIEQRDHFPLHHFWGPLAGIQSSRWIAESAVLAARRFKPEFWYIYLPHLDYAAQKFGPDSQQATAALGELDEVIAGLVRSFADCYANPVTWVAASEYVITPVDHVSYPNRMLRDASLLMVDETDDGRELLDFAESLAWALVDHQFSHVFVSDSNPDLIQQVVNVFSGSSGIAEVLAGEARARYHMDHDRSGDVILISQPNSWQAYYWWQDDALAPQWARTVDIHRKPGYDPVELFFDPATRSVPLDASLVKGSHGAPCIDRAMQGALVCSRPGVLDEGSLVDTGICQLMLRLLESP